MLIHYLNEKKKAYVFYLRLLLIPATKITIESMSRTESQELSLRHPTREW